MNHAELIRFLADAALIGPAQLVRTDFALRDYSRRNRNFAVTWDADRSGYFVKCARDTDHAITIAHEAGFLQAVSGSPGAARWRRNLPQFVRHNAASGALVTRFEQGRVSLRAMLDERQRVPVGAAEMVGRFAGRLHSADPRLLPPGSLTASADRAVFGMTFDCPDHAVLRGSTSGAIAVLKAVQSSPGLMAYYPQIRALWRKEGLVHNDLRWDNLLVAKAAGSGRRLVVIDWELVMLGDPAWDLATIWGEHLGCWLQSIPLAAESEDELHVSLARYPLETLKRSIGKFWSAYTHTRRLPDAELAALFARSVTFLPARLIQSAFEWSNNTSQFSPHSILAVQFAENMIGQPEAAAAHFLGIVMTAQP